MIDHFAHQHRISKGSKGFTLVELLVVIAIIGILASLLLPAVQAAREAARALECRNQLKQIGLALHSFHTTANAFPHGSTVTGTSCTPPGRTQRGAPWTVLILPHLEEQNRFDTFNLEGNFFGLANNAGAEGAPDPLNDVAQRLPVPHYRCPSDPNAQSSEPNNNYYGVQGGGAEADANCQNWFASNHRLVFDNGILYLNSDVSIAEIRDGTTNTLLVGESRWWFSEGKNGSFTTYWTWASGFRASGAISHPTNTAATVDQINNPLVDWNPGIDYAEQGGPSLLLGTPSRSFGSYHSGGCQFAFGDGSVHFLSESIDHAVYQSAGARNDGQPLGGIDP